MKQSFTFQVSQLDNNNWVQFTLFMVCAEDSMGKVKVMKIDEAMAKTAD